MEQVDILRRRLAEKLAALEEPRLQEVLDFVDFLIMKERGGEDQVLNVIGCLSGEPMSSGEIERELYGNTRS
jgi:hypothetical protein